VGRDKLVAAPGEDIKRFLSQFAVEGFDEPNQKGKPESKIYGLV